MNYVNPTIAETLLISLVGFVVVFLVLIVLMVDKLGDNLRMIIDPYSAQE